MFDYRIDYKVYTMIPITDRYNLESTVTLKSLPEIQ